MSGGVKLTKAKLAILANVSRLGEVILPAALPPDVLDLADNGLLSRWPGNLPSSCRVRITPCGRSALSHQEQGVSRSHPSGVGPSDLTAGRNDAEVGKGKG